MKRDIIYIVIIALLIFGGLFIYDKYVKIKDDHSTLTEALEISKEETELYQNKEGKWVAEKRVMKLTEEQLKTNATLLGIDNETLVAQVGKLDRLVSRLDAQLKARGEGSIELRDTVYVLTDSSGQSNARTIAKVFSWNNAYLSLNGSLTNNIIDFDYTYYSTFSMTAYNKKSGLFKKKELVVDIIFDDPGAQTMGVRAINIKQPPKKFYEKTWFWGAMGFVGGAILVK